MAEYGEYEENSTLGGASQLNETNAVVEDCPVIGITTKCPLNETEAGRLENLPSKEPVVESRIFNAKKREYQVTDIMASKCSLDETYSGIAHQHGNDTVVEDGVHHALPTQRSVTKPSNVEDNEPIDVISIPENWTKPALGMAEYEENSTLGGASQLNETNAVIEDCPVIDITTKCPLNETDASRLENLPSKESRIFNAKKCEYPVTDIMASKYSLNETYNGIAHQHGNDTVVEDCTWNPVSLNWSLGVVVGVGLTAVTVVRTREFLANLLWHKPIVELSGYLE